MKEYLILSAYLESFDVYVKTATLLPFMIDTEKGKFYLSNKDYQMLINLIEDYKKSENAEYEYVELGEI